jgi:Skp family chaperone for outer membrane proteins
MKNNRIIESLEPTLIEVETYRESKLALRQIEYSFYGVGTLLFVSIFISWTMSAFWVTGVLATIFVISLIVRFSVVGTPVKDYQTKYSNQLIQELVRKLNPAIKYVSNSYKYQTLIKDSGLLGASIFSENSGVLLNGKTKKGYPFQLMEASLMRPLANGTGSSTPFKGMICVIDGEHYLGEHTIIKSKKAFTESSMSILTKAGKEEKFTLFSTKHKSDSFNEKYLVYTKKRNEVDSLLTKEALQKLDALVQAKNVPMNIVLKENRLLLLLSGVNYFEANIDQSLLNPTAVTKIYDKITASLDLVEELSTLIGGEDGRIKILTKEVMKPLDNAGDSAYDHFIGDEL